MCSENRVKIGQKMIFAEMCTIFVKLKYLNSNEISRISEIHRLQNIKKKKYYSLSTSFSPTLTQNWKVWKKLPVYDEIQSRKCYILFKQLKHFPNSFPLVLVFRMQPDEKQHTERNKHKMTFNLVFEFQKTKETPATTFIL